MNTKAGLVPRLDAYSATLRSSRVDETRRRRSTNWQHYAAVTGSALAMATNASAGIIYSGVQNLQAAPLANTLPASSNLTSVKKGDFLTLLGNKLASFEMVAIQAHTQGTIAGAVGLTSPPDVHRNFGVEFLDAAGPILRNLSSKAVISSLATGRFNPEEGILSERFQNYTIPGFQWASGKTGFAGIAFYTQRIAHPNQTAYGGTSTTYTHAGQTYYGWIRLEFTDGTNGLSNSITAVDWAYNSDPGQPITASEGAQSSTPEPSTGALAILAAGAAGVAALRRRKVV